MAQIKVWDGAAWVEPKAIYVWNGSSWEQKAGKYWDGSNWIDFISYHVIWHCDITEGKVYELNPDDFTVIRSANSPSTQPSGIGGTLGIIWHVDDAAGRIYELSTSDFSVVRSASGYDRGVGGDESVIWAGYDDWIREYSPSNFSVVRTSGDIGSNIQGVGGKSDVIWITDATEEKLKEINVSDLTIIRTASTGVFKFKGCGGNREKLWVCGSYFIDEQDPETLIRIRYANSPGPSASGIGGQ